MTVLEKIKRCVSLVWDFQEFYGEEDIEDFCSNELCKYSQHDEIMEYFKHIEELEKENAGLRKDKEELCHSISEGGKACVYLNGQLTKAKEIIKKLKALYISPIVTKDDVKRQDEILEEAEQFLSEVEK